MLLKLIFFLSFLLSTGLNAAVQKKWSPIETFPKEFIWLIDSVQELSLNDEEQKIFEKFILKIDQNLRPFSKKEIQFLVKSEIYKSILRAGNLSQKYPMALYDESIINNLDQKLNKEQTELHPYSLWIMNAVKSDLSNLFTSSYFSNYKLMKKKESSSNSVNIQKMDKKFTLLLHWYSLYINQTAPEFELEIKKLIINQLRIISQASSIMMKYSQINGIDPKDKPDLNKMLLFKEKIKVEENISDSDEKIIDGLNGIEESKEKSAKKDWTPNSNDTNPFPAPDPSYIPPKELPKPVDDWIMDI